MLCKAFLVTGCRVSPTNASCQDLIPGKCQDCFSQLLKESNPCPYKSLAQYDF